MAMSALVKEQIEGLLPAAIELIPPDKFAVSRISELFINLYILTYAHVVAFILTAPYVALSHLCQSASMCPSALFCPQRWCLTRE